MCVRKSVGIFTVAVEFKGAYNWCMELANGKEVIRSFTKPKALHTTVDAPWFVQNTVI
jgi:hypothetical protein